MFHLNPFSGEPNLCTATVRACPWGGEEEHYSTVADAQSAYEAKMAAEALPAAVKREPEQQAGAPLRGNRLQAKATADWRSSEKLSNGLLKPELAEKLPVNGILCPSCSTPLSALQVAKILDSGEDTVCSGCEDYVAMESAKVEITRGNPSYKFRSKDEVLKATWYHSSNNGEWLSELEQDDSWDAHVGTEDAAFDRALTDLSPIRNQVDDQSQDGFYLYEVKLAKGSKIAREILEDENNQRMLTDEPDVKRYINRWEAPASISLAVKPRKLEIVGKRWVPAVEAFERDSLYNVAPIE